MKTGEQQVHGNEGRAADRVTGEICILKDRCGTCVLNPAATAIELEPGRRPDGGGRGRAGGAQPTHADFGIHRKHLTNARVELTSNRPAASGQSSRFVQRVVPRRRDSWPAMAVVQWQVAGRAAYERLLRWGLRRRLAVREWCLDCCWRWGCRGGGGLRWGGCS